MKEPSNSDRRKHRRADLAAVATVIVDDVAVGHYLVRNLSVGGVLLISGPPLRARTRCQLLLHGPGFESITLTGDTLRAKPVAGEAGVAVAFDAVDAESQVRIERIVQRAIDSLEWPGVLVVDHDVVTLATLADEVFALGRRPLLALTPLEAVRWLCDGSVKVEAAVVGVDGPAGTGADLLAFVADEFFGVQRVLMCENTPPDELLAAVEESCAHAVLSRPFKRADLAAALRPGPRRLSLPISRAS